MDLIGFDSVTVHPTTLLESDRTRLDWRDSTSLNLHHSSRLVSTLLGLVGTHSYAYLFRDLSVIMKQFQEADICI